MIADIALGSRSDITRELSVCAHVFRQLDLSLIDYLLN